MTEKSKKIKWALLIIVISLCLYQFRQRDEEVGRIKQSHNLYCGTILSTGESKGGFTIKYEFVVVGKIINGYRGCTKYTESRFKNGLNNILIIAEKSNLLNNRLLESSSDFEKFNIVASDTLGLSCPHHDY